MTTAPDPRPDPAPAASSVAGHLRDAIGAIDKAGACNADGGCARTEVGRQLESALASVRAALAALGDG